MTIIYLRLLRIQFCDLANKRVRTRDWRQKNLYRLNKSDRYSYFGDVDRLERCVIKIRVIKIYVTINEMEY